jgi:hypothetical protein
LLSTENNGTRLYDFDDQGKIIPKPVAVNEDLAPDTSTPVLVNGELFGCWNELACLDVNAELRPLWTADDEAFQDHVSMFGSADRILIVSARGELLLLDSAADQYRLISRLRLFDNDCEVLSHPALVGKRLYIRDTSAVCCVALQ